MNKTRWTLAAGVALGLVVPTSSGFAGEQRTSAPPAKLIGEWSRVITRANYVREGIKNPAFVTGRWRIVVDRNGFVDAYLPPGKRLDFTTKFTIAGKGRITIGTLPICSDSVDYAWKLVRGKLKITKLGDDPDCPVRPAMFVGTWTRTSLH